MRTTSRAAFRSISTGTVPAAASSSSAFEPLEHPADRRRRIRLLVAVDRARDDQPLLGARHRDVVEAQLLRLLLEPARLAHLVVVECAAALRRHRIGDAEAEAAVGEREDLVRRRRRLVAARVGDDHDLELEALRRVDRQQANRVGPLLLRDCLELARADRLLLVHEADEALDVGAAQLLVRAREPRELAHVRVATPPVPLREHREVVVVLADDALAQPLEREPRHRRREPVEALPERAQQARVALVERRRQSSARSRRRAAASTAARRTSASASFERPTNGDASTVSERLVVVAVVQEPQVREQVDHLLLAEVAPAGRAIRRSARRGAAPPRTTRRRCRPRREARSRPPSPRPRRRARARAARPHAPRRGASARPCPRSSPCRSRAARPAGRRPGRGTRPPPRAAGTRRRSARRRAR